MNQIPYQRLVFVEHREYDYPTFSGVVKAGDGTMFSVGSISHGELRQWALMGRAASNYPESPERLAKRLRALRDALEMTQGEISVVLGGDPRGQLWNNYELVGPHWKRISLNNALELCTRYGVTLDWIYRGVPFASLAPDMADKIRYEELKADKQRRNRA